MLTGWPGPRLQNFHGFHKKTHNCQQQNQLFPQNIAPVQGTQAVCKHPNLKSEKNIIGNKTLNTLTNYLNKWEISKTLN